jgi:peptidoglycan/LPS O-acetylase OafA/YrhL
MSKDWRGPTIAAAMQRPHDNFMLIRLALALAVIVSHSFSVTIGRVEDEPLHALTGFTLGEHAVNGFFAVSGFLVTMSFLRRGWRDYVVARALRIGPGLIAATLVVALGLGATMTRLPLGEYFVSTDLWRFIGRTLTSFKSNAALPGVFSDNPFTFPMGTVWTLKYETLCYVGVLALGLAGLLGRRIFALVLVACLFAGVAGLDAFRPDAGKGVETALRLPLIFAVGGCLYVWRERVRVSWLAMAALFLAAVLLHATPLGKAAMFVTEAYGVIWLALAPGLSHPRLEPKADLSYGTYLYGWPLQQTLHALFPAASALALLAPAIVITLIVAWASWYLVEKPALGLKARIVGRRRIRDLVAP